MSNQQSPMVRWGMILVALASGEWVCAQEFSGTIQPAQGHAETRPQDPVPDGEVNGQRLPLDFNELRRGVPSELRQTPSSDRLTDPWPDTFTPTERSGVSGAAGQSPEIWPDTRQALGHDAEQTTVAMQPEQQFSDNSREFMKQLLDTYSLKQVPDPLPGQPLLLSEALRETSPAQRRAMVVCYWQTHLRFVCEMAAAQKHSWLSTAVRPQTVVDQSLWQVAVERAQNDAAWAEIELGRWQAKLQQFLPVSGQSSMLPLPADSPLVQGYDTQFDWYESQLQHQRAMMRGIDRALPKMQTLINQRAHAVQLAEQSWRQATQAYGNGQTNITSVLHAADAWHAATCEFWQLVTEYNELIAEYSMTVVGGNLAADQVAMMLIGNPTSIPRDALGNTTFPVRQASLVEDPNGPPTSSVLVREPMVRDSNGTDFSPPPRLPSGGFGESYNSANPQLNSLPSQFENSAPSFGGFQASP
ncbi:MAG TPA: hypothetical protein PKD54_06585, partial [Pirellulaceae bacterium]|nr:hypothetical protein [Pirellulaceae bacterium]